SGALGLFVVRGRGNSAGWGSPEVVGTLAAGALLIAAFVAYERRATDPMIPISFFRSRAFSAGNLAIFTVFGSLFAEVYFFSQFLQPGLGYGVLEAGLRLVPWTATFLVVGPIAGAMTDWIGERPLVVTGLLMQAAAAPRMAIHAQGEQ